MFRSEIDNRKKEASTKLWYSMIGHLKLNLKNLNALIFPEKKVLSNKQKFFGRIPQTLEKSHCVTCDWMSPQFPLPSAWLTSLSFHLDLEDERWQPTPVTPRSSSNVQDRNSPALAVPAPPPCTTSVSITLSRGS